MRKDDHDAEVRMAVRAAIAGTDEIITTLENRVAQVERERDLSMAENARLKAEIARMWASTSCGAN